MCFVSYVPVGRHAIITHNRDESASRDATAVAMTSYDDDVWGVTKLLYPQDAKHENGTWICCNNRGTTLALLNGAAKRHERHPPYKLSRGLLLVNMLREDQPVETIERLDLSGVEPFTVVARYREELFEIRWDGSNKQITKKDPNAVHCWSSSTLYDENETAKRETWFRAGFEQLIKPEADAIRAIHLLGGSGDLQNGLVMNRNHVVQTLSVTTVLSSERYITLQHFRFNNRQLLVDRIARPL
jgi:uncharacterized protein with NRDE domain